MSLGACYKFHYLKIEGCKMYRRTFLKNMSMVILGSPLLKYSGAFADNPSLCSSDPNLKMSDTPDLLRAEITNVHFQNFQHYLDLNFKKYSEAFHPDAVSYHPDGNKKWNLSEKVKKQMRHKVTHLDDKNIENILDGNKNYVCTVDETKESYGFGFEKGDIRIFTFFKPGVKLPDLWGATYRKNDGKWKVIFTD